GGVLVQVVPGVDDQPVGGNTGHERAVDLRGEEFGDLGDHVGIGRVVVVPVRVGQGVRDHHAGACLGHGLGHAGHPQAGGVVDDVGAGGHAGAGDLGALGVHGDHHVAGAAQGFDDALDPVDLLAGTDFLGVRGEGHAADVHPVCPGGHRCQGGVHG